MSQKNILSTIIVAVFLILACTTPSFLAPAPVPTTDPNAIHTTVAETAAKKMTQTAQALEMLLPPTETPVPTPARPTVGSTITTMPNGTVFFSDATTGVEMLVPEGWLVLRIDGPEYSLALIDKQTEYLGLTQYLTSFRGQDPNKVRLLAFDFQEGHKQNLFPTTIIVQTGFHSSAKEVAEDVTAEKLTRSNSSLISKNTRPLASGGVAYIRELTYKGGTISTGDIVQIYQSSIIFESNGKVISIHIEALDELRPMAAAQFEVILASLNLFTP